LLLCVTADGNAWTPAVASDVVFVSVLMSFYDAPLAV